MIQNLQPNQQTRQSWQIFQFSLTQSDIYADAHTLYILSVKQMGCRSHNMNVTTVGPFISLLWRKFQSERPGNKTNLFRKSRFFSTPSLPTCTMRGVSGIPLLQTSTITEAITQFQTCPSALIPPIDKWSLFHRYSSIIHSFLISTKDVLLNIGVHAQSLQCQCSIKRWKKTCSAGNPFSITSNGNRAINSM